MARTGRKKSDIGAYHVILRGQKNLFSTDNDINEFFNLLTRYFSSGQSELYAYSIESKKIHLVFRTALSPNDLIKPLCTSYARYYNRTNSLSGKLFYDRFMSEPLSDFTEIAHCVIFVHSKQGAKTSYNEYTEQSFVCSSDSLKSSLDKSIIENNIVVRFFIDDYTSMTDKQLKKYLLLAFSNGKKQLSPKDKQELIFAAVSKSNLSKSRVCRILDIDVSKVKEIKKREKKNTAPAKNNELSVWLL